MLSLREKRLEQELAGMTRLYTDESRLRAKLKEQYELLQENYYKICAFNMQKIIDNPQVSRLITKAMKDNENRNKK